MSTVLNRSSVKKYALKISAERRAGKFTRVGEDFFLRCEARLEVCLRSIAAAAGSDTTGTLPSDNGSLITITARAKAAEKLEVLAHHIIYTEVLRHPSIGMTLK